MYLEKFSLTPDDIKMAVIIQEMVEPHFSGVCFTQNPMTGSHEIVIEAVPGEGTALVQDGVTPERWISHGGSWIAKPDETKMPMEVANQIITQAKQIIRKIKKPIDLEWVYDGQEIYWVQMREITTLENLNIYSNRISKDMMPGIIPPLVWSINVPLINTIWLELLEEMVGPLAIKPEDLAKSFYYRSYFNMSAIGQVFSAVGLPSEGLEMMMGIVPNREGRPIMKPNLQMLRHVPRMIAFMFDKWTFERKIKKSLPLLESELNKFSKNPSGPIESLIDEIRNLYDIVQKIVYFNVITPILVSMYVRILESQMKKINIDMLQFDLSENFEELDAFNPNVALARLKQEYDNLPSQVKEQLEGDDDQFNRSHGKGYDDFKENLREFIEKFGYLSDNSNNFTAQPWRENPSGVLKMIKDFDNIKRSEDTRFGLKDLQLRGFRNALIKLFYNRARKFMLYREQISMNYVYGYGLFRPYFFMVADWMIKNNWIETREDIFYLEWDEIQNAVSQKSGKDLMTLVNNRKVKMESHKKIALPNIIYGDNPPPVFSESFDRMQGTPTSQGYYSGPIKVIFGRDDFEKVEQGDVIVIPYSDVGWAPLFSRAGAVIAESGGILSHSSIIAREYQIPAIVSVSNCMQLKNRQRVSVNGFTGEIILLNNELD
jgi:pyruvate,water dikinase